jgi:acyl dehydratase
VAPCDVHVGRPPIGQSRVITHHVQANLFYRNLVSHRLPAIGDTLSTVTTVVRLRPNRRLEGPGTDRAD